MGTRSHKTRGERRRKSVAGGRRLTLETLESRTVLSGASLVVLAVPGVPLSREVLHGPLPTGAVAVEIQIGTRLLQGRAVGMGMHVDRHQIEPPLANFGRAGRFADGPRPSRFLEVGEGERSQDPDPPHATWDSPLPPGRGAASPLDLVVVLLVGAGAKGERPSGPGPVSPVDRMAADLPTLSITVTPPRTVSEREDLGSLGPPLRPIPEAVAPAFTPLRSVSPAAQPSAILLDDARLDASMTSWPLSSTPDGGGFALTTDPAWGSGDGQLDRGALFDRVSTQESALVLNVAVGHEPGTDARSGGLSWEIDAPDAATELTGLWGDLRYAGSEGDTEGGVVDIGESTSSIGDSFSARPVIRKPSSPERTNRETLAAKERLHSRPSLRSELNAGSRRQDEPDAESADAQTNRDGTQRGWADAEGSRRNRVAEEGGAVELVVAAYSTAPGSPLDDARAGGPAAGRGTVDAEGGPIPMDKGVGLFQAFDLAGGPNAANQESQGGPAGQDETATSPAPATANTPADQAAQGTEAKALPLNRAWAVPSASAVLSSLLSRAGRGAARDDSSSSDVHGTLRGRKTRKAVEGKRVLR